MHRTDLARTLLPLSLASLLLVASAAPDLSAQDFRRGDVDGDGVACTMGDVSYFLPYLFNLGFPCQAAADLNDDSQVTLADLVELVTYMAGTGTEPPAPGPFVCGPDPTDPLFCAEYNACPTGGGLPLSTEHILKVPSLVTAVGGTVTVPIEYDNLLDAPTVAFAFGVCHDASGLQFDGVELGPIFASDPFFFSSQETPLGWSVLILDEIHIFQDPSLQFRGVDREILTATYTALAPGVWPVELCTGGADPEVEISIAMAHLNLRDGVTPTVIDGSIEVLGAPLFRRGDANLDGGFDVADPVAVLAVLFSGAPSPTCVDAADANDDGAIDLGDPITMLGALFGGDAPPAAPGPTSCGIDPTPDSLDCTVGC